MSHPWPLKICTYVHYSKHSEKVAAWPINFIAVNSDQGQFVTISVYCMNKSLNVNSKLIVISLCILKSLVCFIGKRKHQALGHEGRKTERL